ncbi:MAG: citrate/2-methylcitrate synthase [Planctomycetota bacterium]
MAESKGAASTSAKGGLEGVTAADSSIGKIDGVKGELRYRGYLITELAKHSDYVETVYLLFHGELPSKPQHEELRKTLIAERQVSPEVMDILRKIAPKMAPMDALRSAVSALCLDDRGGEVTDRESNLRRGLRLVARFPILVAAYDRLRDGKEPLAPRDDLDHAANFLYMLTGEEPKDDVARMFDVCLVLHAEHGFNASTFAGRVTAATLSDVYSAITSAIGALKGPLHGGANTAVMNTLLAMGNLDNVEPYLDSALARGEKIMGFGHRVYKVVDPRALILREFAERMADLCGDRKWFEMSAKLENLVKTRKRIDMNVDFYSASTYYYMGIKPDLYTTVFAISRVAGWVAHVLEQYANNRLIRPRSNWVGPGPRDYVTMDKRG